MCVWGGSDCGLREEGTSVGGGRGGEVNVWVEG